MSDQIEIRESEKGVVRVFQLDLPDEAVERYTVQAGTGEWPLKYGLGATHLRPGPVDVVRIDDLGAMPLSAYLAEAHGVQGAELKQMQPQLDALKGHVIILPSYAFEHKAQTLTVRTPLRWIGTFTEAKSPSITPPLQSASAKGSGTGGKGGKQPDYSFGRWFFLAVAAVLVFAFWLFAIA